MENFLEIDWNPPLDDMVDNKFVDADRFKRESVVYRMLKGKFTDPFANIHEEQEGLVTPEILAEVAKENKDQKLAASNTPTTPSGAETNVKMTANVGTPYIPGMMKSNVHFPRRSSLNGDQQALCLRVLLKFCGSEKPEMTAVDKSELQTYMALSPTISQEQKEFLELAKSHWDSAKFKIHDEEFINEQWKKKIQRVETLPRYYTEAGNIPFVSPKEIGLNFNLSCLERGLLPMIFLPVMNRRRKLFAPPTKINQRFFSAETNADPRRSVVFKTAVSQDPNCDALAKNHDVDLVISSGGLNCLALNMDPQNTTSWILPVVVKRPNEKNVVYIDKPLPPTGLTVLQKNSWIYKYKLKAFLTHPYHTFAISLDEETEKEVSQHRTSRHFKANDDADSPEKSEDDGDESTEEDAESSDVNKDLKKSEDQNEGFLRPPVGHNLSYRLFSVGSSGEHQSELLKNRVEKAYKLLVRTKTDGIVKAEGGQSQLMLIAPKVEHQLGLGAEAVTVDEAAKQWIALTFRPDTTLARVRIDSNTTEMIQIEKRTATSVNNEIKRLYKLKTETVLTLLYNVAETMTNMPPGRYLIRHSVRSGAFASVYKETEEPGKNVFDIQAVYCEDEFRTIPNPTWPAIDTGVVTPYLKFLDRMPAMFQPRGLLRKRDREIITKPKNNGKKKKKKTGNQRPLTEIIMPVVDEYFRTGVVVYLWSKYLWQQILERRQRSVLNTYKTAPAEIREAIDDEEYETNRDAAFYRSGFHMFKRTLDVGLATSLIFFEGYRKLWDKSGEIVAYFDVKDSGGVIKNALFLTMMSSATFLVSLPFAMFEIYVRRNQDPEQRVTLLSVLLSHSIAQTLLFPFVCLFVAGFKLGGDNTLLWAFGFAEFQLVTDLLNVDEAEPLPACDLRQRLEELAKKYKFPLHEVLVEKRSNGLRRVSLRGFPRVRTIVLSEELTLGDSSSEARNITVDDVNALVAREMSHWKYGHSYINFVVNQTHLCLRLYTMHRLLNSQRLYDAFSFDDKPLAVGLILMQFCPLFDLYNFVARTISRRLEFAADRDVKRMQGDVSLKKAIVKIGNHAKFFPVQDSIYSACYNSQAASYERIQALNELDNL